MSLRDAWVWRASRSGTVRLWDATDPVWGTRNSFQQRVALLVVPPHCRAGRAEWLRGTERALI